jgi:hypothetical protein
MMIFFLALYRNLSENFLLSTSHLLLTLGLSCTLVDVANALSGLVYID